MPHHLQHIIQKVDVVVIIYNKPKSKNNNPYNSNNDNDKEKIEAPEIEGMHQHLTNVQAAFRAQEIGRIRAQGRDNFMTYTW